MDAKSGGVLYLQSFISCEGIEEAKVSGKPTTTIIMAGRNVLINDYLDDWDSCIMCYLPGSEGGYAVADVLTGDISPIDNEEVYSFIRAVVENKQIVAGICNGVDELENAGILEGIESTHSTNEPLVVGDYIITARANMYVDMAIAIGKKLNLFVDEADLQETIDFWKFHKTL